MANPDPNLKDRLLNELGSSFGAPTDRVGEPSTAPAPPRIPDHVLLRCIGKGSYGEVWLARNALGTFRAVKIVRRKAFDSDRPYEREFAGICRFEPVSRSHPSQLNVLHVGRDDAAGLFYYVMELADDVGTAAQATASAAGAGIPTLDPGIYVPRTIRTEIQKRGRLPCAECVDIGTALATALAHLHRHGLVHRDIKPSNIIFVNGIPKLADIGLVTHVEATLSFVGTEGYVPPEGPGSPQADVYSLGKVLYEMSTGRDRQDYPELPTNLIEVPVTERAALAELNEVIVKASHADSQQRYQTATELHADLALLQSGKSVSRIRTTERRLRIVARAGALVTAMALVVGVGWFWQARQTGQIRQLATEKAQLAEENSQRVVRLDIANGLRLLDQGDPAGALLWFADALPRLTNNPDKESIHRIRIQQTLDRIPRLLGVFPHESSVYSAVFSPDGRFTATGTREGNLRVWNVGDGSLVWGPKAMGSGVRALRFSRDGKRLFASSSVEQWAFNGDVDSKNFYAVLEADSGRELFSSSQTDFTASTNLVCSHFSPDDRWLVTAQKDNRIRVLDLLEGRWVAEFTGHQDEVRFLSVDNNGRLLASASLDRTVRLWRLPSGEPAGPVLEHPFPVVRAVLTGDGQHLLTACFENPGGFGNATSQAGEGEVQAWEATTGRRLGETLRRRDWLLMYLNPAQPDRYFATEYAYNFSSPGDPVCKLDGGTVQCWDFSRDSRWVALGEARNTARVFDSTTGELIAGPFPHGGEVSSVRFSPDERKLLTGGSDGIARLWDLHTMPVESASRNLPAPIKKDDPVGFGIVVGRPANLTPVPLTNSIPLLDEQLRETTRFPISPSGPGLRGFKPAWQANLWLSWQQEPNDKTAVLWLERGAGPSPLYLQHPDTVATAAFTRDDQFAVTSCRDGVLRFWRTADGVLSKSVAVRDGGEGWVAEISPAGNLGLWVPQTMPGQPIFRIVDLQSGKLLDSTLGFNGVGVLSARFSPNEKHLAVWDFMGEVRVFDCRSGRVICSSIQHSGNLSWVEWDPGCQRLLTAGFNEDVLVWDVQTGAQLFGPLRMPGGSTRIAHWSPDGRFIAARDDDRQVRVWESATGAAITPLLKHSGDVLLAVLMPGNRLLTASYPDLLRVWDLKGSRLTPEILADYARFVSGRQLTDSGTLLNLKSDQLARLYGSLKLRASELFQ